MPEDHSRSFRVGVFDNERVRAAGKANNTVTLDSVHQHVAAQARGGDGTIGALRECLQIARRYLVGPGNRACQCLRPEQMIIDRLSSTCARWVFPLVRRPFSSR
jgi:hypothetical protein